MIRRIFKYNPISKEAVEVTPGRAPEVNAPYVQDDTIPPTMSHATDEGKVFDSRSKLYAHYKENGFECTGGSHLCGYGVSDYRHKADIEEIRRDCAESLRRLQWGMVPVSDKEREICKREERAYQEYCRRQRG